MPSPPCCSARGRVACSVAIDHKAPVLHQTWKWCVLVCPVDVPRFLVSSCVRVAVRLCCRCFVLLRIHASVFPVAAFNPFPIHPLLWCGSCPWLYVWRTTQPTLVAPSLPHTACLWRCHPWQAAVRATRRAAPADGQLPSRLRPAVRCTGPRVAPMFSRHPPPRPCVVARHGVFA